MFIIRAEKEYKLKNPEGNLKDIPITLYTRKENYSLHNIYTDILVVILLV
jgi:hypothetical protein